jgi:hypothetical protein
MAKIMTYPGSDNTSMFWCVTDIIGKAAAVSPNADFFNDFFSEDEDGGGGTITNAATLTKGALVACRLVTDLGLTKYQAAAILGNLYSEGFPYPDRIQGGGIKRGKLVINGTTGYGWAQWTSANRQQGLANYAKSKGVNYLTTNLTDEVNYGYLVKEFKDTYLSYTNVKSKTTLRSATEAILKKFESPADQSDAVVTSRTNRAQQFLDEMLC